MATKGYITCKINDNEEKEELKPMIKKLKSKISSLLNKTQTIREECDNTLEKLFYNYTDFISDVKDSFGYVERALDTVIETIEAFNEYAPDNGYEQIPYEDYAFDIETRDDFETTDYSDYAKAIEWGMDNDTLILWVEAHKNGTRKQRQWIEDLFTDINYHHECTLLYNGEYDKLLNEIED